MRTIFKNAVVYIITLEARAVLNKYKPKIVAVTGSVGKTSTKDAIYAVLAKSYRVRKSEKSFNSEIGLPLTILGAPNPEWLVLEVGADRPGDIRSLAGWLPVNIAVITRLPEVPVHVEFFDSPEAVVEEKAAIIDCFGRLPAGRQGVLALFYDDARTRALEHRLPAPDAKIISFGFGEGADVRGEHVALLKEKGGEGWPIGMTATITADGVTVPLEVAGAVGPHAFLPALLEIGRAPR